MLIFFRVQFILTQSLCWDTYTTHVSFQYKIHCTVRFYLLSECLRMSTFRNKIMSLVPRRLTSLTYIHWIQLVRIEIFPAKNWVYNKNELASMHITVTKPHFTNLGPSKFSTYKVNNSTSSLGLTNMAHPSILVMLCLEVVQNITFINFNKPAFVHLSSLYSEIPKCIYNLFT